MLGIYPQSPEQPRGDLRTKELPQRPRAGRDNSLLRRLCHDEELPAEAVQREAIRAKNREKQGRGRTGAEEPLAVPQAWTSPPPTLADLQASGATPETWTQALSYGFTVLSYPCFWFTYHFSLLR